MTALFGHFANNSSTEVSRVEDERRTAFGEMRGHRFDGFGHESKIEHCG